MFASYKGYKAENTKCIVFLKISAILCNYNLVIHLKA